MAVYDCLDDIGDDRIERLFGSNARIELFARQSRAGWDAYGNEVDKLTGTA